MAVVAVNFDRVWFIPERLDFIQVLGISSELAAFGVLATGANGQPIYLPQSEFIGVASEEAFTSPVGLLGQLIAPASVASEEAFTTITPLFGQTIAPAPLASEEAFTAPVGLLGQTITPASVASEEAFTTPGTLMGQTITPASVPSEEAFTAPGTLMGQTINPSSVASEEAFTAPDAAASDPPPAADGAAVLAEAVLAETLPGGS